MRRAAAALLFALLAAGCANPGSGSGSGGPPPPAPTSTAPTSTLPVPVPPPVTGGPTVTVDGVVEKGVEPGCLVLRAGTKSYLLMGVQASAAPTAVPVRVTGELVTDVASYCQQGTPLQVTTLTRR
jgi:hypothetical protein